MNEAILNIYKILGLSAFSFFLGIGLTPILTHFLYKYKMWRKDARTTAPDGSPTPIFNALHKERETKAPRMSRILIWFTTIAVALIFYFLKQWGVDPIFEKLNFLSRSQTWVPLGVLLAAALVGLLDDFMTVLGKGTYKGGGLALGRRLFLIFMIALLSAYWFYSKLEMTSIFIPGIGYWEL